MRPARTLLTTALLLALFAVPALAATTYWPMWAGDAGNTGRTANVGAPGATSSSPATVFWSQAARGSYGTNVITDPSGNLYVEGAGGLISFTKDRVLRWDKQDSTAFTFLRANPVVTTNGNVYAPVMVTGKRSSSPGLVAYGPTGNQVWVKTLGVAGTWQYYARPVTAKDRRGNDLVFCAITDAADVDWVCAFNVTTGKLVWKQPGTGPVAASPVEAAVYAQYVTGSPSTYYVRKLNRDTGAILASDALASGSGGCGSLSVGPDGTVYVPDDFTVRALDGDLSGELWSLDQTFPAEAFSDTGIGVGDGKLYVTFNNPDWFNGQPETMGGVLTVDAATGQVLNKHRAANGYVGGVPTVDGAGRVYYLGDDRNLYCLNPDGSEAWRQVVSPYWEWYNNVTIAPDGTLYLAITTGEIIALR